MRLKYCLPLALIYFLGIVYLSLPSPVVPDLAPATRSNESGDTWQHPDQKGFYTNLVRSEVIPQMQSKFTVKLFNLVLPSYRLNYRPEESFEFVRDQTPSYYLEEIVYPFRESLFVNGWEPTNSPTIKEIPGIEKPKLIHEGVVYLSKITLRPVYSAPWARMLIWTLVFPSAYLAIFSLRKSINYV